MQGLVESLENGDFILKSKMVELNQNKKFKTTGLTRWCVKNLVFLENKSIIHLTQMFTLALQNRCSENVKKFAD